MKIKFIEQRSTLMGTLYGLSSETFQNVFWVEHNYDTNKYCYSFDEDIHFLFDDTELANDPYSCIGLILIDKKEAEVIENLTEQIDKILSLYGTNLLDEEYVSLPEWVNVLKYAKEAFDILYANTRHIRFFPNPDNVLNPVLHSA